MINSMASPASTYSMAAAGRMRYTAGLKTIPSLASVLHRRQQDLMPLMRLQMAATRLKAMTAMRLSMAMTVMTSSLAAGAQTPSMAMQGMTRSMATEIQIKSTAVLVTIL